MCVCVCVCVRVYGGGGGVFMGVFVGCSKLGPTLKVIDIHAMIP